MGRTARLREAAGVATWLQALRAAGPLHFEPETSCCAPAAATGIGQPLLRLWECADSCGRCQRSGMFRVTVHGGHGAIGRTCCTAGHRRRQAEGQLRVGSSCWSLPIPVIGLVTDGGRALVALGDQVVQIFVGRRAKGFGSEVINDEQRHARQRGELAVVHAGRAAGVQSLREGRAAGEDDVHALAYRAVPRACARWRLPMPLGPPAAPGPARAGSARWPGRAPGPGSVWADARGQIAQASCWFATARGTATAAVLRPTSCVSSC